MTWAAAIALIVQYGIPVAESLFQKWSTSSGPTVQDWADLKALAAQTAQDRAKAALTRAGIALDSPQALQLLALVG